MGGVRLTLSSPLHITYTFEPPLITVKGKPLIYLGDNRGLSICARGVRSGHVAGP